MIKVKRLRHVTFASPDVEAQLDYYRSIIGLAVIGRDDRRVILGTDSDELTLVLEHGSASRLTAIAYEVAPGLDLSDLQKSLASLTIKSEVRSDTAPGISKTLVFNDPDGLQIELFSRWDFCKPVEPIRGLAVAKLGHVALYTPDPERATKFFERVLGFRVSDRIEENFVFLRCGPEHHAMNFARGAEARIHHLAFELRDASHMHQACDLLGRSKFQILWGPVRHGPGHNVAVYHHNPDHYLIELYYSMDLMLDEELGYFEPRPWHRDRPQRPKTWVGLPRDVWGVGPAKEASEFSPIIRGVK
ncbi:MAG TPA: VOC family protein [Beijerinckiaceae bacterium]|nr:VOC family protein [Beijerinckiaceae bacterium]